MLKEKLPSSLESKPVTVFDSARNPYPGQAGVKVWTPQEAFKKGFLKAAKVVGILIILPLPLGFLDPFAFMVWGTIVFLSLILFVGPYLHLHYWKESASFFYVQGTCPYCHQEVKLEPYVDTAFRSTFTVICPACGQTSSVQSDELKPGP